MQQKVLNEFLKVEHQPNLHSAELALNLNISHDETVSLLKSLEARFYFELDQKTTSRFVLSSEGETYSKEGSPEYAIYSFIRE